MLNSKFKILFFYSSGETGVRILSFIRKIKLKKGSLVDLSILNLMSDWIIRNKYYGLCNLSLNSKCSVRTRILLISLSIPNLWRL